MKIELYYPIKPFEISQAFGQNLATIYKEWGLLGHPGIDMVGTYGQVVRSACEGIVTYVGYDSNEGQGIVIRTEGQYDYEDGAANFKHIYWHLMDGSVVVKVGDRVRVGDLLAQCDSTGVLLGVKFGPAKLSHLHFGVKPVAQGESDYVWDNLAQRNGYNGNIDPAQFWNGRFAADMTEVAGVVIELSKITGDVVVAPISNEDKISLLEYIKKVVVALWDYLNKPI